MYEILPRGNSNESKSEQKKRKKLAAIRKRINKALPYNVEFARLQWIELTDDGLQIRFSLYLCLIKVVGKLFLFST